MRKLGLLAVLMLFCSQNDGYSQGLSHQVLVPLANVITGHSLEFTYTIGESAIESIGSSGYSLTQGFQQPRYFYTGEITPGGNGVEVYPNPATDFINVEFFGNGARTYRVEIMNFAGTILFSETVDFTGSHWQVRPYPAGEYSRGLYLVRIISSDLRISRVFKIEKM